MSEINIYRISLLLITDDRRLGRQLTGFFTSQEIDVKTIPLSRSVDSIATKGSFDLTVLDCTGLGDNGVKLCNRISEKCPVLMISPRDDEYSVITGLDCGAEDYIPTPVRQWELLARIKNILRRTDVANNILRHGDLTVDTVKGVVLRHGEEIYLSALEYRILLIFLSNKDRVLTRQQLLDAIWNIGGDYVNDNTLTVYIKRIREKIEENPSTPQLIKTVRGKGYKVGD